MRRGWRTIYQGTSLLCIADELVEHTFGQIAGCLLPRPVHLNFSAPKLPGSRCHERRVEQDLPGDCIACASTTFPLNYNLPLEVNGVRRNAKSLRHIVRTLLRLMK